MRKVFWASDDTFAAENPCEGQHGNFGSQPSNPAGKSVFARKAEQTIHTVKEIDSRAIAKINHGIGPDGGTKLQT
jgi:hypothetical protein